VNQPHPSTEHSPEHLAASRARLQKLSYWLDEAIRVPVLGWRIGFESLLGLIPVVGDVAGLLLGLGLVAEGVRLNVPRPLLARMLAYCVADALIGFVPLLGDALDFAFKSNLRNARLLLTHLDALEGRPKASGWSRLAAGLMIATALAAVAGSAVLVWRWL
jgi:hypothetical protein